MASNSHPRRRHRRVTCSSSAAPARSSPSASRPHLTAHQQCPAAPRPTAAFLASPCSALSRAARPYYIRPRCSTCAGRPRARNPSPRRALRPSVRGRATRRAGSRVVLERRRPRRAQAARRGQRGSGAPLPRRSLSCLTRSFTLQGIADFRLKAVEEGLLIHESRIFVTGTATVRQHLEALRETRVSVQVFT